MRQFAQLDTGRPSKFGVQAKYVDRELNLVDDALAGAVPAAEQLKIFDTVVGSNAVDVMDCLIIKQFSSKMLGHGVPMFEYDMSLTGSQRRDRNRDVPVAFEVPLVISRFKAGESALFERFVNAFFAAIFLLAVYSATLFSAAVKRFFAIRANTFMLFIGSIAVALVSAISRAVWGWTAPLFHVGAVVTRFVKEGLTALPAFEFDRFFLRSDAAVHNFKSFLTILAAKFARGVFRFHAKDGGTLLALNFDGHVLSCDLAGAQ